MDFVTLYTGQYWEPILGMCLYSYLDKKHFIDSGLKNSGINMSGRYHVVLMALDHYFEFITF